MPLISEAAAAAAAAGQVRPVMFLKVASTPPIRAWSGVGNFEVEADDVELTDNATYLGVGIMRDFPVIEALVNGVAQRLEVGISGVDPRALALALGSPGDVRGKDAWLGMHFLGPDEQPLAPMWWFRKGKVDGIPVRRRQGLRTIGLSIGTGQTGRRRPSLSFWIHQEQIERSADDKFCIRTPRYERATRKWPRWNG